MGRKPEALALEPSNKIFYGKLPCVEGKLQQFRLQRLEIVKLDLDMNILFDE